MASIAERHFPAGQRRTLAILRGEPRPGPRRRLGMRFEAETTGRALGLAVPDVDVVLYATQRPAR